MVISPPKSFGKLPNPRRDFKRTGRPRSQLFKALQTLKVKQFIEVSLVTGQKPSLATLRASLPRWQKQLGYEFSYRTNDNGTVFQIFRVR